MPVRSSGCWAQWTASDEVGDSALYQSGNNIGIGNTNPSSELDVSGTVTMTGFKMPTNATSGYVLTAATSGVGTWQETTDGSLPSATSGNTLYYDEGNWKSSSLLTNTGDNISIGTDATSSTLSVEGDALVGGDMTVENGTPLIHLVEENSGQNLDFSVASTSAEILTDTDLLTLNSSSGDIKLGNNVGIGTGNPSSTLEVAGTTTMAGFKMPTNATSGYVLTADSNGVGTWQSAPSGTLPSGSANQTLYHNGSDWTTSSLLNNTGTTIGIGTVSTTSLLTIATSGVPQLSLENGSESLQALVSATNTTITASGNLVLNTDSGELSTNATLVDASNATVSAATFESADATVRSPDEYVLRGSVPIFSYENPAQTATSNYRVISKKFATSSLSEATPDSISGATRTYAFLINYADNIPTTASSSWKINKNGSEEIFTFAGQDNSNLLDRGYPHLTDFYNLPDNNWQLEVNPDGNEIMVHNILLLVYDKVE